MPLYICRFYRLTVNQKRQEILRLLKIKLNNQCQHGKYLEVKWTFQAGNLYCINNLTIYEYETNICAEKKSWRIYFHVRVNGTSLEPMSSAGNLSFQVSWFILMPNHKIPSISQNLVWFIAKKIGISRYAKHVQLFPSSFISDTAIQSRQFIDTIV